MKAAQLICRYRLGELIVVDAIDDKRVRGHQRGWRFCRDLVGREVLDLLAKELSEVAKFAPRA